MHANWYLYLVRCGDGSLYTGISTDVERRMQEHLNVNGAGRGAKFLRGKQPLQLVYQIAVTDRSKASRLEYVVKKLSKQDKEALVNKSLDISTLVSEDA